MEKIVILGGGESGVGSAILAQDKGFDVFLSDSSTLKEQYKEELRKYNISFEEGKHSEDIILSAKEIINIPVIPNYASIVVKAKAKGIPILSEMEFAKR